MVFFFNVLVEIWNTIGLLKLRHLESSGGRRRMVAAESGCGGEVAAKIGRGGRREDGTEQGRHGGAFIARIERQPEADGGGRIRPREGAVAAEIGR